MISLPYTNTKPPQGSQVDYGHPLMLQNRGFWPFWESGGFRVQDVSRYQYHWNLTTGQRWSVGRHRTHFVAADDADSDAGTQKTTDHNFVATDFTACAIARYDSGIDGNDFGGIVTHCHSGGDGWCLVKNNTGNGHKIALLIRNAGSTNYFGLTSVKDTWYHICGVQRGGNQECWVNGSLAETGTGLTPSSSVSDTILGRFYSNTSSLHWSGDIAFVAIWARALTVSEIQSLIARPYDVFRRPKLYATVPAAAAAGGLSAGTLPLLGVGR